MFIDDIELRAKTANTRLCVGLDPSIELIDRLGLSVFDFNKQVIDATQQYALCYKPQIAHYSASKLEETLEQTIGYIKSRYPHIPVILDSKRGDIGTTADKYAIEAFERYLADAVTVNPYLGFDSVGPFLRYENKGVIVLAKTSNPSSSEIQCLNIDGVPLYVKVVEYMNKMSGNNKNLLYVIGATDTAALKRVAETAKDNWLLVPGVGAQGGQAEDVLMAVDSKKVIINVTRAIINQDPSQGDYFEQVSRSAAEYYKKIEEHL